MIPRAPSQDSEATPRELDPVHLTHRPSEAKEKLIARLYNVNIVAQASGVTHPHAVLAVERELAITHVVQRVKRLHSAADGEWPCVVDHFGKPTAFKKRHFPVHSTIPVIDPSDVQRLSTAPLGWHCEHHPLSCTCGPFDLAFFVQSVQYLRPEQLGNIVSRMGCRVAYSIVHRFSGLSGNFYNGEQTWYRDTESTVVCTLDGGLRTWRHSALDWLDKTYYCPDLGCVLVSTLVVSFGETHVYMHTLRSIYTLDQVIAPQTSVWSPAALVKEGDFIYSLPNTFVGNPKIQAALSGFKISNHSLRVWNGLVVFRGGQEENVVLSAAIVSAMVTWFYAKEMGPATYRLALSTCRGHYAHVPNLPEAYKERATIITVVLAMSTAAEFETGVLVGALWELQPLIKAHNQAVQFKPPFSVSADTVKACVASTTISVGVASAFPTTLVTTPAVTHSLLLPVVSNVLIPLTHATSLSVPPIALAWGVISTAFSIKWAWDIFVGPGTVTPIASEWSYTVPGDLPAVLPSRTEYPRLNEGMYPSDFVFHEPTRHHPRFPGTQRVSPPNTTLAEGTSITVRNVILGVREPPPLLVHSGIAFSVIPTYFESNQSNLVSAATNRVLMDTPQPDEGLWEVIASGYNATVVQSTYFESVDKLIVSRQAATRWADKYPVARSLQFMEAFDRIKASNFILNNKMKKYSAFTKTEKLVSLTINNGENTTGELDIKAPRLIHAPSDERLILEGPVCEQVAAYQKAAFTKLQAENFLGLGPRHCSAEVLGEWFGDVIDLAGGPDNVLVLADDGTKWDAHVKEAAIKAQISMLYKPAFFTNDGVRTHFLVPEEASANSRLGVKYHMGIQRVTGEAQTDLGNTKLNEAKTLYCLGATFEDPPFSGFGKDYFLSCCGDDSIVVATKSYVQRTFGLDDPTALKRTWAERGLKLGFTLNLQVGPCGSLDFCSKWFYPVDGSYILGGKIGRTLARAGFFLDLKNEQTILSAATGCLQDNFHVPFLKEYFQKVIELAPGRLGGRPQPHGFHAARKTPYDDTTWDFVTSKYGLTKQDLEDFQTLLNTCVTLPVVIDWPCFLRCLEIDA